MMTRSTLAAICAVAIAWLAGSAAATPQLGDDCKACHNSNVYLPPAHPNVANMSSAVCQTCHVATMTQDQDQTRTTSQIQQQDQDQDRDQQRDQNQSRQQVRLGGDPAANVLGTHAAARKGDPGKEIEQYLNRAQDAAVETGEGYGDDEKFDHEHHNSDARMAEDANQWRYRLLMGYLYSSDIEQHQSGGNLGGGGSHEDGGGGEHGLASGHDEGEGDDGSYFRVGARADYTSYIGNDQTLTYSFTLNRDDFTGLEQIRYVGRVKLDWHWKLDDGSIKVSPYIQRSSFDVLDGEDRAFWALGLNANRNLSVSPTEALSLTFRYKQRRYDGEDTTRRADLRLGTVYQHDLGEWGRYRLGFGLPIRNNPKRDDKRYTGQVLTAGFGGTLTNGAFGWLSTELGRRVYRDADRTAGYVRKDSYIGLGASYVDPRLEIFGTAPQFSCQVRWTDSNIAAYDTTSTYCALLFDKRF